MSTRLDFRALADALATQAEAVVPHLLPSARRAGPRFVVGNLRGEPGESLSIPAVGELAGRWKDFSTDEHGDLLNLWATVRGLSLPDAANEAAAWLGWGSHVPAPLSLPRRPKTPDPVRHPLRLASDVFTMTDEQVSALSLAAVRLLTKPGAIETIARARQWQPDTIERLTRAGFLGLAKDRAGNECLAFMFDTALKLRLKPLDPSRPFEGKKFDIMFGGLWLWRAGLLFNASGCMVGSGKVRADIQTVFLTEGETDCISLLDAGLEDDGKTLVLAVPGAGNFKAEWAPLLAGKDVVIVFDDDEKGQAGAKKVAGILRPVARSVRAVDLQPLLAQ